MIRNKILVIGVDGLDPLLISKWKSELSTLSKLIENGTSGILKSSIPPISCPAWVYFSTGKQAGKLGFTDFFIIDRKREAIYPVNSARISSKFFWEILDEHGIKCCIINMPLTYPPRKLKNGIIVSGFPTPINYRGMSSDADNIFTYPPDISLELNRLFPDGYEIDISESIGFTLWDDDKIFNKLLGLLQKRTLAFNYILDRNEWDMAILVYTEIDRASHFFYGTSRLKFLYKMLDRELKKIIDKYGAIVDHIIILSDHGFMELNGEIYINDFLEQIGYLKYEIPSSKNLLSFFLSFLKYVPNKLTSQLLRFLPEKLQMKLPREKTLTILDVKLNRETKIYHVGDLYAQFYLNVESIDDFDMFLEEILQLRDRDGNKIFEKIYFKTDLYVGNMLKYLPDLIVQPRKGLRVSAKIRQKNLIETNIKWKGDHFEDGVHIWYGKGIESNKKVYANIFDIAPTILHIFDLSIPNDMDGKVLKKVFKKNTHLLRKTVKYEKLKTKLRRKINKLKSGN